MDLNSLRNDLYLITGCNFELASCKGTKERTLITFSKEARDAMSVEDIINQMYVQKITDTKKVEFQFSDYILEVKSGRYTDVKEAVEAAKYLVSVQCG